MKFLIVAMYLAFVNARVNFVNTDLKCISIRDIGYEQEEVKNGVQHAYNLAIDYNTNTLFFVSNTNTTDVYRTSYLNLDTREYGLVTGIDGGFANAVNSKTHEVYMGGSDGLYIFDYNTKSAVKINGIPNADIWQMFYKDGLYFTTYPDEKAFLYKNNKIMKIPELKRKVTYLAVKNNGDYVYSNFTGNFIYDKLSGNTISIIDSDVNGITADISGNVYFTSPTAVYYINDKNNEVETLFTSTRSNIYGIAVDRDGYIIYAKENNIVRLKPSEKECKNE